MKAVTAAAAAGLLVVSACGGGPGGQSPAAYVHAVCTGIATYESALVAANTTQTTATSAAQGDPRKIKVAAVAFFASQVTASAALQQAVTAQGRPSGSGGDAVRTGFVTAVDQVHTIYVQQQAAVSAADATNRITFFEVLNTAQAQVTMAGQALETGLENVGAVGDDAINAAIRADQTCSGL